jgi:hypothetical protein
MKENWECLFRNPSLKQAIKKLKFSTHFHLKCHKYDYYVSRATHFRNRNVNWFYSEVCVCVGGDKKIQKTHLNSLVTIWCIWKRPYIKYPINIAQSKKLARVMQSFHLKLNQFYSYHANVYTPNFTPCCLVHCLKEKYTSGIFTLTCCVYLY